MENAISALRARIAPEREAILNHPLYLQLNDLEALRTFSEWHVYAVWDFMSLLKGLQRQLTCVELPWLPVGSANSRFLINEIVVGEESDVDRNGIRMSHFEMYLNAMENLGANTTGIRTFIGALRQGASLEQAFEQAQTPEAARSFVRFTFELLKENQVGVLAAVFTFGREDLIPDMFYALVQKLGAQHPEQLADFIYYLERHIEVDGGHHSHLALEMTRECCGENRSVWEVASDKVAQALMQRRALWDGVLEALQLEKVS
ncbi:MAG: heme oxygenase [Sphingobacteriaceae bacterium]|nr:heme oxygenase [Sphingobacteriaceae bacterium]